MYFVPVKIFTFQRKYSTKFYLPLQKKIWCNLIFVNFRLLKLGLTLLLKCDDDQGHENIYEEEREHDEVDNIKNGHFDTIYWYRPLVFICYSH